MELTKLQLRKIKTAESWIKRANDMILKRESEIKGLREKIAELERMKAEVSKG